MRLPKIRRRRSYIISGDILKVVLYLTILALTLYFISSVGTSKLSDETRRRIKQSLSSVFLGFDITDKGSVILNGIPLIGAVSARDTPVLYHTDPPKAAPPEPFEEDLRPIEAVDGARYGGVFINNETEYTPSADSLLAEELELTLPESGPGVLIIHTHATESYMDEGKTSYDTVNDTSRNLDENKNILRVGQEMAEVLRLSGINVLHDKTLHDYPSFNKSYQNSLATIESYKAKYPSIRMVIDVHRDAIIREDGTSVKLVNTIDGQAAAQLMLVVGTNAGGLTHDNWRDNLRLAVHLQALTLEKYPGLARPINLRKERFNQHATAGSMLIEVGSSGNTLEEAILGGRLAAECIAELLMQKS